MVTNLTAHKHGLAVFLPRARQPAAVATILRGQFAIHEYEAVWAILRRGRRGDITFFAVVAYLTAVEQGCRGAKDEVDRTLYIAILIILASKAVGIECVLKTEETAVLEEHFVTAGQACDSLTRSHARRILERNVLAIEIVGINEGRGRAGSSHLVTARIEPRRTVVECQFDLPLAEQRKVGFALGHDNLLVIDAVAHKDGRAGITVVGHGVNGLLHGEEITRAILSYHKIVMAHIRPKFRNTRGY